MQLNQSPMIMGVLNATPDSYFDQSRCLKTEDALTQAEEMIEQGAAILDIGGESTRPGAKEVSVSEEMDRVLPLLEAIKRRFAVSVSIDTRNPKLMQAALELGADMINDIQALENEGALETIAQYQPYVCLMHMQGTPRQMQQNPVYNNVTLEIVDYLAARKQAAIDAGIDASKIILDPGFGFGKTLEHNLSLLRNLKKFKQLQSPILIGISRKSMFQHLLNLPVEQRLPATLSATALAVEQGVDIIRTHDVKATKECCLTVQAILAEKEIL